MAITGTGTEADPYLVHDYTELHELKNIYTGHEMKYAKLCNDINCNDYGSEFQWETVQLGDGTYSGMTMILDLDGHTIKNVALKSGNKMFQLKEYAGTGSGIKNGKILNVFTNGANAVIDAEMYNGTYIDCSLNGISFSINATGEAASPFVGVDITACAIYLLTYKLTRGLFDSCTCKQSDVWFDVKEVNYNYPDGGCSFDYCRIRGTISGSAGFYGHNNNTRTTFNNNFSNCVIEIDNTDWYREGAQYNYAPNPMIYGFNAGTNTCIINKDKICDSANTSWQFMTTEQIRDGSYINSKGFVVVEVGD